MRSIAILQARCNSSRLFNKVLLNLLHKPMIIHQLQRCKKSKSIDNIILATSDKASDDKLAKIVKNEGYDVFRGDIDNVLKRFYDCASSYNLDDDDIIVRLTGDCPLLNGEIIDELVLEFKKTKCDYMANCVNVMYPDGFDVEVFSFASLKQAYKNAFKPSQKEHVTPYIRDSGLFNVQHLKKIPVFTHLRFSVDERADFEVIENIYTHFNHNNFTFDEIIDFCKNNPSAISLNKNIQRNEGYLKSLKEDNNE